jgi:hypothetical protein
MVKGFASDVFSMLSAAGATITVADAATGNSTTLSCQDFIGYNLHAQVIRYMTIPLDTNPCFMAKVTSRVLVPIVSLRL